MENSLEKFQNIYIDKIETKEDALKQIEKGLHYKQNRIEKSFYEKFTKLRKKIHKIIDNKFEDPLDYDTYVNSILIDCRAIFLENTRYKFNSTLQNTYRARGLHEYADSIDDFFNQTIKNDKTLKEIIKEWVDQRLVHYDYLEENEENLIFENITSILDRNTINNLFIDILIIAQQYEEIKKVYGENAEEQFNKVIEILTGFSQENK
jgi:hypothetical protein